MKEELLQYGLSEKEIEIYVACLKLGSTTSQRLSELTSIRRSTVYEIIETLKKKGLIAIHKKDKKLFFTASEPESLIKRLKEKEDIINKILPDLKKLTNVLPEKPSVNLYEGKTSIKDALEEVLSEREILVYGASQMGDKIFEFYTSNFAKKRVKNKVVMKAIIESNVPEHMLEKDVRKYTFIRKLTVFENHNSVYFIYGKKVIIISLGEELIAIKINSPLLAESQRQIFNLLWKIAKK